MTLQAGSAYLDVVPKLADGFGKKIASDIQGPIEKAEGSGKKLGLSMSTIGKVAAGAFTAMAASATVFAKISVDKFKSVGAETVQLQRLTGGTAEEMSRLRYAAQQSGVGIDTLGNGMRKLSQEVGQGGKDLKAAGISFTDAKGKALPLSDTLANVADKFAKMPNGIEKNNLAIGLFGKAGTELLPILNRGSAGLDDLAAAADKYGLTLSQGNLDAIKKSALAHKEFDSAVDGLKVRIGAVLMPVLAAVATSLTTTFVPAIVSASSWIGDHLSPIIAENLPKMQAAFKSFVDYVKNEALPWIVQKWKEYQPSFSAAWEAFKKVFLATKDVILDQLIPRLADLLGWLKDKLGPAASDLAGTFKDKLVPALGGSATVGFILGGAIALQSVIDAVKALSAAIQILVGSRMVQFLIALSPQARLVAVALAALAVGAAFVAANWEQVVNFIERNQTVFMTVASIITAMVIPSLISMAVTAATSIGSTIALWVLYQVEAVKAAAASVAATARSIAGWAALQLMTLQAGLSITGAWIAQKAQALASLAAQTLAFAGIVAGWVGMQIAALASAAQQGVAWVISKLGALSALPAMAIAFAGVVAGWALMGLQSLLNAAKMAAAWLIALGPIGIVIAAVIAVVALIIANWDTISRVTSELWNNIKQWTSTAFQWVKDAVSAALRFLVDLFLNFTGPGLLIKHWDKIWESTKTIFNWVTEKIGAFVDFFLSIPDKLASAGAGMFNFIQDAFRGAINWVIDKWNALSLKMPEVEVFGQKLGGFTLNTPDIPRFEKGGLAKGTFLAGEKGAELVTVGRTSRVLDHEDTMQALSGNGQKTELHKHYHYHNESKLTDPLVDQFRDMERLVRPL